MSTSAMPITTTPLDEVISCYDDLVKAGKVRELGASNYTAARLGAITKLADRMGRRLSP